MQDFPHHYVVNASNNGDMRVQITASGLSDIESSPPAEFGGPGDRWSPETLLMAAAADCFILTFKAIARASSLEWQDIQVEAVGTLERVERITRFTRIEQKVRLTISDPALKERAASLLEKSEHNCLVSNSLNAEKVLTAEVVAIPA